MNKTFILRRTQVARAARREVWPEARNRTIPSFTRLVIGCCAGLVAFGCGDQTPDEGAGIQGTGGVVARVDGGRGGAGADDGKTGAVAGGSAAGGTRNSEPTGAGVGSTGGSAAPATGGSSSVSGAAGAATGGASSSGTGGIASSPGAGSGGAGAGGTTGTSGSGGVGGTAAGGAGKAGGSAGSGGASSAVEDLLPPRVLNVTASEARHQHSFRAKAADPEVSFNDNTQIAVLDNRATTLMGKLVLPFGGAGVNSGTLTGAGEFCARRGFHVLAIATFQDYDIVSRGPDFFGNARRTAFEGVLHTREGEFANIAMTPAGGVAQRTQKALQYLHSMFPEEDWGYYLQEDGSVRWSDVIFTGMSHGASNSARFGFLVRASRVVSSSGPRDNLCTRVDLANCGGDVATWFSETPKTPIDRFYAITGRSDSQHTQHLFAMEKLGYVGKAMELQGSQPPYGNTHRLIANAGHVDFCGDNAYAAACNYVFGVPPENQAGTAP
jgi:hypothetical protein